MHFVDHFSFMKGGDANTRDIEQQKLYHADPYRRDSFSYGFFHSMLKNHTKIKRQPPRDLPLLLISGTRDRVGGKGLFIRSLYKAYLKNHMKDLTLLLYKDGRHELLNDIIYQNVQNDVLDFYEHALNEKIYGDSL